MSVEKIKFLIIDSISSKPVPYVAIFLQETGNGALTDENGECSLNSMRSNITVKVSQMGYRTEILPINSTSSPITIKILPEGVLLNEVTVKKKKEHYSKRNNKAVELMEKVRAHAPDSDPKNKDYYTYNKYEKINIALNHFNENKDTVSEKSRFDFLSQYVDTAYISGNQILNISLKEKLSKCYNRKSPRSSKEEIIATRRVGLDEFVDQSSVQTFLEDVLREIDIYNNDINILQYRFVSPLSNIAAEFYKFYITDTINTGSDQLIELSFVPRVSTTFGFTGKFLIATGDSSYIVNKAVMSVPTEINLNFVDQLHLTQEYKKTSDGKRVKTDDDMTIELSLIGRDNGLYIRRISRFDNHSFDEPTNLSIFDFKSSTYTVKTSATNSDEFWIKNRPMPISKSESGLHNMIDQLRSQPVYYWGEKILKVIVNGYINTSTDNSKFDIGPVNTMISTNDVEGVRFRLGGMTTANLSKRWFGRGYVAYGTKDKKFKYSGEIEYSFIDKEYHSREFPVQSLRLTHKYDVDMIGQHYLFTNPDNVFLSLKRMRNRLMTYQRLTELKYTYEMYNNLTFTATFSHSRQEATPFVPFVTSAGTSYRFYNESALTVGLRYAPGEKFYQTKTNRISINFDAPVFTIEHTYGPAKLFGNTFTINRTEVGFQNRFWFSAFGFIDCVIKGGHIWSATPYPSLLLPDANLSYIIEPESFALMNPLEFISDSYCSVFVTYWANGAIFNYIPLIKKLKLREVFSARGYLGNLSHKNVPSAENDLYLFPEAALATPMHGKPYVELSAGIDNLFKVLRVDYVWRATYRNIPSVDRDGVRISVHITF